MGRITGPILALDLGIASGFARGAPGDAPQSGTVQLKKTSELIDVAYGNLIAFLCEEFGRQLPAMVVKERMLYLQAFTSLGTSEKTIRAHAAYHGIVEGLCVRYGVRWEDVSPSTFRRHFIGAANAGSRDETKQAVVDRCHLLKLMPADCRDDNRADAIAVWDWAAATFGRRVPADLHLFGERKHA
jgi:hypothetical protein